MEQVQASEQDLELGKGLEQDLESEQVPELDLAKAQG